MGFIFFLTIPYSLSQNDYWNGPPNTFDDIDRSGRVGINLPVGTTPQTQLHMHGFLRFHHQLDFAVEIGSDRFIHNNGIINNTFIGRVAGVNTIGEANSFFGEQSGFNNVTGNENTFAGFFSGFSNTEGHLNTFIGSRNGATNETGNRNTSLGAYSFFSNTTGSDNVSIGFESLRNLTTGTNNTVVGAYAAQTASDLENMTIIGANAMTALTTPFTVASSVIIGSNAWENGSSTGHHTVAIGHDVMRNAPTTEQDVYIGEAAGFNSDGAAQTVIGYQAGLTLTQAFNNTLVGWESGYGFDSQRENVAIGSQTAVTSGIGTAGDYNTLIGTRSSIDASSTAVTQSGAIGFSSEVCDNYTLVLGAHNPPFGSPPTTVVIGGCEPDHATPGNGDFEVISHSPGVGEIYADVYNTPSDKRLKTNIEQIASPIKTINGINGYLYSYKNDIDKLRSGVIAQELAEHFPYAVKEANSGYYVVNYDAIIPLLLQGIKEQQDTISSLKTELNDLKQEVEEIKQELGISKPSVPDNSTQNGDLTGSLKQNKPNPFSEETVISYSVEGDFDRGTISILDFNGQQIKDFRIRESVGEVRFNGSGYPAGIYFYGLFVDGELLDIKKMIIAR